ncbi:MULTISPECIES: response regulator [unclassified Streptomyces]|jgi:response regulator of citrate/malate metabolism|uniref:response regulator n=1 Tax=unclassified Streptomyces TaxID=2593676 RepID=UPI003CE95BBE
MFNVLVVDDDFYVARINAHYVSEVPGFRVAGIVHSAAPAFAAIERGGIDLILLDQFLPNESGLSLTRRLRQQGHGVDIIMVTADRRPASVHEALRSGALYYLAKPFTSDGLRSKLEAYAQLRGTIADGKEMDQARIDRTFGALRTHEAEHPMPKGYSERTAELVSRIVADHEDEQISAQEVSELARISRSTAQRYLKYLAAQGKLQLTLRYGDSGRPQHLYSGL